MRLDESMKGMMVEEFSGQSIRDLLRLHAAILDELRTRGVLRSSNGPAGDYAELLFQRAFGWTLETNSASGHDAVDAAGLRYQIKCRRLPTRHTSRQLSAIRNLDASPFDVLAALLLDSGFGVMRAALIPISVVRERAKFMSHTNSWRFMLQDAVWDTANVRDVTAELSTTQAAIS